MFFVVVFALVSRCLLRYAHHHSRETILQNHMSAVTGMALFPDETHALSISRDKVIVLWDIVACVAVKTIPVYEVQAQVCAIQF